MTGFFSTRQTRGFLILWAGQFLSVIGSGMTSFVLAIWTYQRQFSTGQFATIVLAASLPGILMAPFAGTLIDRWDKRKVLAFAVAGQALATGVVALLFSTHRIETYWQIYPAIIAIAVCGSFQGPALTTIGSALLPEDMYSRATGLWQLNQAAVMIVSPVLAAIVMPYVRIEGVISFDAASYLFALLSLWLIQCPKTARAAAAAGELHGRLRAFLGEVAGGWRYIRARNALLRLLAYTLFLNVIFDMVQILVLPLAVKGGTPGKLASVMAFSAFGMVFGSIIMAVWRGPSRQILGVLASGFMVGLALLIAGPQQNMIWLTLSFFAFTFFIPLGTSTGGAIWMRKTDPAVLGRVTATTSMLIQLCFPVACFIAPLLADRFAGPLLAPGGALVGGPMAHLFGVGFQRGVGLLLSAMGLSTMLVSAAAFLTPRLRRIESELPEMAHAGAAAELAGEVPVAMETAAAGNGMLRSPGHADEFGVEVEARTDLRVPDGILLVSRSEAVSKLVKVPMNGSK